MQRIRQVAVQRVDIGSPHITRGGPQAVGGARLPAESPLPPLCDRVAGISVPQGCDERGVGRTGEKTLYEAAEPA